jgi:hypothetical protein
VLPSDAGDASAEAIAERIAHVADLLLAGPSPEVR